MHTEGELAAAVFRSLRHTAAARRSRVATERTKVEKWRLSPNACFAVWVYVGHGRYVDDKPTGEMSFNGGMGVSMFDGMEHGLDAIFLSSCGGDVQSYENAVQPDGVSIADPDEMGTSGNQQDRKALDKHLPHR
jgi:hypothetical protein